jgi:hypothetical protein
MSGSTAAAIPTVHVSVTCMPARSHSTAPGFDGNALNLCLYFDEVESLSIDAGDNLNTTQTPECTKEKYNAKIKVKGSLLRSHQQPM